MCMQDWRVARLVRPNLLARQVQSLVITANQQRIGLMVVPDDGTFSVAGDAVRLATSPAGIPWYYRDSSEVSSVISVLEFGSLVTNQIEFSSFADANGYNVFELTMPEDYLAAGLAEFESQYKVVPPSEYKSSLR